MFIVIEENPNCEGAERMFSTSGTPRTVQKLLVDPPGGGPSEWREVMGVSADGLFAPAQAIQVEDSSDGAAWLVFGGNWGLRLKIGNKPWSLADSHQWGVPFMVLDIAGSAIKLG